MPVLAEDGSVEPYWEAAEKGSFRQNLWVVFKKNGELCSVQRLQFQMRPAEDLGGRLDLCS